MINFRINKDRSLAPISRPERNSWIDVLDPAKEELELLEREYRINPEHLQDIMDLDEQARIEKEDEYTLIIVRLPFFDARSEVPYFTLPCGILLFSDRIVTICQRDCEVLEEMRSGREKGIELANKSAFVLHLLGRAAIVYLRHLKEINRRTTAIERDLQRSVKNNELTHLLSYEKCLVFFTTSLKSNEILLEKLQSARLIRIKEDEAELLEDVLTDNKQAIEMANIYSDILSGMMDAFASVISNNLNIVMKRLTIISIVMMIPTLIVSMFGMNVKVPFEERADAFLIIACLCVGFASLGAVLLGGGLPRGKGRRGADARLSAGSIVLPRARKL
jgi:magnesium transporter